MIPETVWGTIASFFLLLAQIMFERMCHPIELMRIRISG
jgi:hypothetical protein